MEVLKVDRTKLQTVRNYAVFKGITPQHVYNLIRVGKIKSVVLDGVTFILHD